jgi:O-antigen ligase
LLHVAALVVFATWDFGGETDFASSVISWWGSLAMVILVLTCMRRWKSGEGMPGALPWLLPPLLFNLLVLVSVLNPSFTQAVVHGAPVFMKSGARPGWPSSARPLLSLRALWQFDAIFLTCFNLAVAVIRQRVLRWLLFVFTINALALAVMGTFQKLAQATGLYFGAVPSPNSSFFASFIYHNHWGAFTVLATSAALGLLFHHVREGDQDDRRHSPVFFAFVAILFIAASVPLSASRSCTVLLLVLLTGALLHWLRLRRRQLKTRGGSLFLPAVLSVAVFAGTLGAIYILGKPTIEARLDTTRQQIGELRSRGDFGSRQLLYADTWHMAGDKFCFGWGLGAYATVFPIYNSQYAVEPLLGQTVYTRAHSDWLQAVAEVGLTGTLLLLLTGLIPLAAVLREHRHIEEVPRALLAGCGLIGLYAWVEFPFANPAVLLAFWLCFFAAVRYHKLAAQDRTTQTCSPSSS